MTARSTTAVAALAIPMTTKARQALTLITLTSTLLSSTAQTAQSPAASASAPAPSFIEETLDQIKNPVPWLTWGGDLRIRNEYFDNALSLTQIGRAHV